MAVYFTPDTFHNLLSSNDYFPGQDLLLYHLNAQSLRNKIQEIEADLQQLKYTFDIIGFSETWYSSDADIIQFPDYDNISMFRKGKRGGGVSLYVKKTLPYDVLDDYTVLQDDIETVAVMHRNTAILLVYRPPSSTIDVVFEFLQSFLENASMNKWEVVIFGDLNIDLNKNNSNQLKLLELTLSYGCKNIIGSPTRVTEHSETLIDVCFTSFPANNALSGVFMSKISDHFPFFALFPLKKYYRDTKCTRRSINEASIGRFCSLMAATNWTEVYCEPNPSKAYDIFLETCLKNYNDAFPRVIFKKHKRAKKVWITPDLYKRINKKNRLFAHFLKTKNQKDLIEFKKFRNKLNTDLKKARSAYYENRFSSVMHNPKLLWQEFNKHLTGRKTPLPSEIIINGITCSGEILATQFNKHFLKAGATDNAQYLQSSKSIYSYIFPTHSDSLFLAPTSEKEITHIINALKNTCAPGDDDIRPVPIKAAVEFIIGPLTYICNRMLITGVFPEKMSIARVTIIFKGGNKTDFNNYRPISVLPLFSKIAERVIYKRISSFFTTKNVICKQQYGFQTGKSTETALLNIKEKIISNFEQKLYTIGIFIDFRKAFDSIKHDILIKKLEIYGIRGLSGQLIESYLSERKQYTQLHETRSETGKIKYGVPQGSILGPLLFLAYINDIVNVPLTPDIVLYADDTNVFFSGPDLALLESKANAWLNELHIWLNINKIALNVNKTKFMIFAPKNKPIPHNVKLHINHSQLMFTSACQFLGVCFKPDLSWSDHVSHVCLKVSRSIGLMYRLRQILPMWLKKRLYFSLIHSHLVYCHLVWGLCNKTDSDRLQSLQRKALRFICPISQTESSIFQILKILPFAELYSFSLAISIYHQIRNNFDLFSDKYLKREVIYNLRTSYLVGHRPRTNYGNQTMHNQIVSLCNSHPSVIDEACNSKTIWQYKRKMKLLLLDIYDLN